MKKTNNGRIRAKILVLLKSATQFFFYKLLSITGHIRGVVYEVYLISSLPSVIYDAHACDKHHFI